MRSYEDLHIDRGRAALQRFYWWWVVGLVTLLIASLYSEHKRDQCGSVDQSEVKMLKEMMLLMVML